MQSFLNAPEIEEPKTAVASKGSNSGMKVLIILSWIGSLTAAGLAGLMFLGGITMANGAPQEAALAGMCLVIAVIPYCIARALTEIYKVDNN